MKSITTSKKQKFVGFKTLTDLETGEEIPMILNQVEDRDYNFHKVWLRMFIEEFDRIANKKMKLAFWVIDHLDSENKLVYTFRKMAEETGLSYPTVVRTMKELQEGNPPFLKKLHSGAYVINPDILYKGKHSNRMGIVYQFGNIPTKDQAEKRKSQGKNSPSDAPEASNSSLASDERTKTPEKVFGFDMFAQAVFPKLKFRNAENEGNEEMLEQATKARAAFFEQFKTASLPKRETEILEENFKLTNHAEFWYNHRGKNFEEFVEFLVEVSKEYGKY